MDQDIILEARDLTKTFSGFVAVSGVNLRVRRGAIHALIGPNGAGKTTCFNLLTKFLSPTSGQLLFKGEDITARTPVEIATMGMVRSFQISSVFPNLSVLENVRLGLQRRQNYALHFWRSDAILDSLNVQALEILSSVGLADYRNSRAVDLPYGRKRALEIAATLSLEPELMLLDEPTAGMGMENIGRITALIRQASARCTILLVEHNLNVVASLCDRVTVLQRGEILIEGTYDEVAANPDVLSAYLGVGHE